MDDDERRYGDNDAQQEMAEAREAKRRAMWRPSANDPYPDWDEEEPDDGQPDEAQELHDFDQECLA